MKKIHLADCNNDHGVACNQNPWKDPLLITNNPQKVTCQNCRKTKKYRQALKKKLTDEPKFRNDRHIDSAKYRPNIHRPHKNKTSYNSLKIIGFLLSLFFVYLLMCEVIEIVSEYITNFII